MDLRPGSQVLIADGSIVLEVVSTDPKQGTVRAKCLNSATLGCAGPRWAQLLSLGRPPPAGAYCLPTQGRTVRGVGRCARAPLLGISMCGPAWSEAVACSACCWCCAKLRTCAVVTASRRRRERKNMNLPGVVVDLPTLTKKDEVDLVEWGVPNDIDFIAASFVRKGSDIEYIRKVLWAGRAARVAPLMTPRMHCSLPLRTGTGMERAPAKSGNPHRARVRGGSRRRRRHRCIACAHELESPASPHAALQNEHLRSGHVGQVAATPVRWS